ncbi:unnamed protein product [Knipowitschia caucasica]|uniref:Protein kinase domain-containing protein n=1 Tax=Knipowitschia caucasica TaxID=637954 RepID=A0AAV2LHW8_KNICA
MPPTVKRKSVNTNVNFHMGNTLSSAFKMVQFRDVPIQNIPSRYHPQKVLGKGSCAVVLQCEDSQTKQTVAVKLSTSVVSLKTEVLLLKQLNEKSAEDSFVKVLSSTWPYRCLVMEMLDMDFSSYVRENAPMRLQDIRTVMEQLAVALKTLKNNRIIHTDFKLSNIMLEDTRQKPLKVKIIDFGLAVVAEVAKEEVRQPYTYRAPEVIFRLPFSAALDIWSLGCIMANMAFGVYLFPGKTVFNQLYYMTMLLGPAPQHILNSSAVTKHHFTLTKRGWVLNCVPKDTEKELLRHKSYSLTELDAAKSVRLEPSNCVEAEEREQCIELLKAMLTWDEKDRITARDILQHPFITRSFLKADHNKDSPADVDRLCYPSTSQWLQSGSAENGSTALNALSRESCSETSFTTRI